VGLPFLPAILAAVALAGVFGVLISLATARMSELVQSLATLGLGETMSVVAYNVRSLGGANSFSGIPADTTLKVALIALLVSILIVWFFDRSLTGTAARAVRDSPAAAAASGVRLLQMRLLTFALGAGLAGLAGAVSAHYTLVVSPGDLAFPQSFSILIFVLFGGSYALSGALAGAFLLTVLPELFRFSVNYRFVFYGLAVVLIVLLRPQGLITRRGTRPAPAWRRAGGSRPPEAELADAVRERGQ
jgi:branched-chain amino acid transport system permease protein